MGMGLQKCLWSSIAAFGAIVAYRVWRELPWTLQGWQALVKEEAVDPNEEIVDAHHHFWSMQDEPGRNSDMKDFAKSRDTLGTRLVYAFTKYMVLSHSLEAKGFFLMHFGPARSLDSFLRPFLASHLKEASVGHKVAATVYVECGWSDKCSVSETAYQFASRQATGLPSAMIANIMLADGPDKAKQDMDRFLADAQNDRSFLVGFRSMQNSAVELGDASTAWPSNGGDPRPLDSESSVAAAKVVGSQGYVIDLCVFHNNLQDVISLVKQVPETTFVLDHLGIPVGVGNCAPYGKVLPDWRRSMMDLAQYPNVRVKLSGAGMPVFGFGFEWKAKPPTSDELVSAWGELMHFVIGTFGVDRCFFGSNFPVDGVSCSYSVLWNAFKKLSRRYAVPDRRKLLRHNAIATYKLRLA